MSDTPTPKPKKGLSMMQLRAPHEKDQKMRVKETGPGIIRMQTPKEGKECGYIKAHTRQENKFNKRGATVVWNKKRPHKPANVAAHRNPKVPDPVTPSKVQPPECKKKYGGLPIQ